MIFYPARSGRRSLCLWLLPALLILSVRPFRAAESDHPENLPAQSIGANDLLSIVVYGAPELTRTVRVGADGEIRMPMLSESITAAGRMPAELETALAEALAERKILVDPVVTVSVSEYHSHPISVAGAVKAPITFQAMGKTTLLEALTRAQGLTQEAGPEILVSRPPKPGSADAGTPALVERVPVKGLIEEANPAWNLTLEGGEEIRVPQVGRVFVVGNVKRPGGFRVEDGGEMTVLKALALAEGLAPFSAKVAYIFRRGETKHEEVAVELRKIMDRKASDVLLGPNDIFYVQAPTPKGSIPERYFHFDSWRVNTGGSTWVPAQIYVEEEGDDTKAAADTSKKTPKNADKLQSLRLSPHFKAQSRIWDYAAAPVSKLDELTSILIESENAVRDQAAPKDVSPLESQRSWERQAEENLLGRLEKGGFLAPPGSVDQVLDTVLNNLIVSAKLDIDAHCRVLLTTPMETFSIGHTVVISRGLIDVLPDETSLALVLAAELSHIALGHRTQTQFAFTNQTMLSDAELLQRFRFQRSIEELTSAGKKTVELMRASPYQNTANAGLFLKALQSRMQALPRLLQANLGNQVANTDALARLADFTAKAPALEENKLEQIAALPLGSRVKVAPWKNQLELIKARPISLLSPREKMPFEVTPFVLYLTRAEKDGK